MYDYETSIIQKPDKLRQQQNILIPRK